DLAAGILAAVDGDATGILHVTNAGETSWHGFTEAIMELAGVAVPVEPAETIIAPGAADRPLNGVLVSSASERAGLPTARHWRGARGTIVDVMVDIRRGSPTFGEWEAFELSEDNMRSVYCPVGFAHGFCVLSDVADVMYKQSNYYADGTERGIAYNDPDVAIQWPLPVEELSPSQRDSTAPLLRDIEAELPFVWRAAGVPVQLAR